eukprot:gene28969-34960_t
MSVLISNFASEWHIFLLALGAGLGCHFLGWNEGLQAGVWSFFLGTMFISSGYLSLALCMAEMTSTLPFAGGNYGFCRVSLGAFWGYFVGYSSSRGLEIVFWLVFLIPVLVLHCTVGPEKVIPYSALLASAITAVFVTLFLLSAMMYGNASKFPTYYEAPFETRPLKDFTYIPYASWFFLLSNLIPLIAGYSSKSKEIVASLLLMCFGVSFVSGICLFFAVVSFGNKASDQNGSDDDLKFFSAPTPMYLGFSKFFELSPVTSMVFSLFPPLITVYVLFLVLVRQVSSMANSGLLPRCLRAPLQPLVPAPLLSCLIPWATVFVVMICLSLDAFRWPDNSFYVSVVASYLLHLFVCSSYLVFKRKYTGLDKPFINPLGIYAAIYAIFVFSLGLIFVLAGGKGGERVLRGLVFSGGVFFVGMVYYMYSARANQCFSEEEQKVLFVAYVINANARSRMNRSKSSRNLMVSTGGGSKENSIHRSIHLGSPMRRIGDIGKSPSMRALNSLLNRSNSSVSLSYSHRSSVSDSASGDHSGAGIRGLNGRVLGIPGSGSGVAGDSSKKQRKFRGRGGDGRKSMDRLASKIVEGDGEGGEGVDGATEGNDLTVSDNNTNESSMHSTGAPFLPRANSRLVTTTTAAVGVLEEVGEKSGEERSSSRSSPFRIFPDPSHSKVVPLDALPAGAITDDELMGGVGPAVMRMQSHEELEGAVAQKKEADEVDHILNVESPQNSLRRVVGGGHHGLRPRALHMGAMKGSDRINAALSPPTSFRQKPKPTSPHAGDNDADNDMIVPLTQIPAGALFRRSMGEVVHHDHD